MRVGVGYIFFYIVWVEVRARLSCVDDSFFPMGKATGAPRNEMYWMSLVHRTAMSGLGPDDLGKVIMGKGRKALNKWGESSGIVDLTDAWECTW